MRLIDADALLNSTDKESVHAWEIALAPTIEAEPTEEQVKEYCRKRCLVVVDSELFNEMKSRWSRETVKHGHWIDHQYKNYPIGRYECSVCGAYHDIDWKNCPDCGAKMDEDWEEPEINPCRGCTDYDGQGGCKSNGGCGAERRDNETY